jgi:protein-S-isoprenylcysteine O-methyltransferase Ste14
MTFIGGRGIPVALFGLLAISNLTFALHGTGATVVYRFMAAVLWAMFLVMVLRRAKPVARNRSLPAVLFALASCVVALPLGFASAVDTPVRLVVADVLLIAGAVFSIYAAVTLGRCFSVLADARALITKGPYRVVRHPLYLGELTTMLGFVIASRQLVITLASWLAISAVQAARAHYEERTLDGAFPAYQSYIEAVPYRIIPHIY